MAYRGNYDLTQHQEFSKSNLTYFDEKTGEKLLPHVIEPSVGIDRLFFAVITDALCEVKDVGNSVLEGNTDLVVIASELGTTVQNATNINFNAFQIPGVGVEPAVIGTVSSLEVDQTSTPIAGNNGVFIVKVTSINQGIDQDITGEQTRLAQSLNFRATSQAFEAHRNSVEITDKRSKFY